MNNIPYIKIVLVLLAVLFVPIIPNDQMPKCEIEEVCEDSIGYISVYTKYFSGKY